MVPDGVVLGILLKEGGDLLEGGVCEVPSFDLDRGAVSAGGKGSVVSHITDRKHAPCLRLLSPALCIARYACAPCLAQPRSCRPPPQRRGELRAESKLSTSLPYIILPFLAIVADSRLPSDYMCATLGRNCMVCNLVTSRCCCNRGKSWRRRRGHQHLRFPTCEHETCPPSHPSRRPKLHLKLNFWSETPLDRCVRFKIQLQRTIS